MSKKALFNDGCLCLIFVAMNSFSIESEQDSNEETQFARKLELNDAYSDESNTESTFLMPQIDEHDQFSGERPIHTEPIVISPTFKAVDDDLDGDQMEVDSFINRRILLDRDDEDDD